MTRATSQPDTPRPGANAARVLGERTLSAAQLARQLPAGRGDGRASPSCVSRWITAGVRGPGGRRVRLEAIRVGGRWMTSKEAFERFTAALTPAAVGDGGHAPRGPGDRMKASERAAAELERVGI